MTAETSLTGVQTSDQRRISVVCRNTRVDMTLPAHLELGAMVPNVVDIIRTHLRSNAPPGTPIDVDELMGNSRDGGGWSLSRLTGDPLSTGISLAKHGVHNGEILVLTSRTIATPDPYFDDVVDAVTSNHRASRYAWTPATARIFSLATVVIVLAICAGGLLRQWLAHPSIVLGLAAALTGLMLLAVSIFCRILQRSDNASLVSGALAIIYAVLSGIMILSAPMTAAHTLAAAVLAAATALALYQTTKVGTALYSAVLVLSLGVALASAIALALDAPPTAAGAAMVIVSIIGITISPRLTISAVRLPIPTVPSSIDSTESSGEDSWSSSGGGSALPSSVELVQQSSRAQQMLTGLLGGFSSLAAIGAILAAASNSTISAWAAALATLTAAALLLRGRSYIDHTQRCVLTIAALAIVVGILTGASISPDTSALTVLMVGIAVSFCAVLLGAVLPNSTLNPATMRAIDILEMLIIVSVIPVALAVLGVYQVVRNQ